MSTTRSRYVMTTPITDDNIHELVIKWASGNRVYKLPPISTWDVSRVTNMNGLFNWWYYKLVDDSRLRPNPLDGYNDNSKIVILENIKIRKKLSCKFNAKKKNFYFFRATKFKYFQA